MTSENNSLFKVDQKQRYRAIDELIEESRGDSTYYTLLILSTVIISAGVLLANSAILIGGMLVTPVLTPILLIALAITASKPQVLKRTGILILKSVGVIFAISFVIGLLFNTPESPEFYQSALFNNSLRSAFLYFLVAFASGIAATFAWIRKEVSDILPGIAIAVSLVPPLSMVAIWMSTGDFELMRFFLLVFLFNLFGIIMAALIVFSLLRFYRAGGKISTEFNNLVKAEIKSKIEQAEITQTIDQADQKLDQLEQDIINETQDLKS